MPEPLSILNWSPEEDARAEAARKAAEAQTPPMPDAAKAEAPAPDREHVEVAPTKPATASPAKMILGLMGALLLVAGVFAPLISVPIVGSVSYVSNGRGDGVIVLILGIVALVFVVTKLYKALPVIGALALLLLGFTYFNFQSRMGELQANMNASLSNNPFRGIGEAMMAGVQMQWGWGVLLVGALLLILTPLVRE